MKENETGRACGTYGGRVSVGKAARKRHLEDLGINERIILNGT